VDGFRFEPTFQLEEQLVGFRSRYLVLDRDMRPEFLQILRAGPGAETMDELASQVLQFRAFDLEGDTCSQMLNATDGREEFSPRQKRFTQDFLDPREPLSGEMMEDGDMRLEEIAVSRKMRLPETIERLHVIRLDMSGYDHWRQRHLAIIRTR
jgi:hypothetical protein